MNRTIVTAAILFGFIHQMTSGHGAEVNPGGGSLTPTEKVLKWAEKNPDTFTGIVGGIGNLNGGTPQSTVLEGAAEQLGAGIGESISQSQSVPVVPEPEAQKIENDLLPVEQHFSQ